jgi:hypothetical protein
MQGIQDKLRQYIQHCRSGGSFQLKYRSAQKGQPAKAVLRTHEQVDFPKQVTFSEPSWLGCLSSEN